ncbi:putative peptidoglycan glycosyltransferase FtsW [Agromyces sp. MMS24-JH15]|uniref:peptidoglycan glycosyltransferase FtsW n=1 Tax=Agromyces sp. MMS24-JH15 TaxID=3243765 RepID=UPI003749934F
MTTTPPRTARPAAQPDGARGGVAASRIRLGGLFRAESADYYLLLGTTLFLTVFGLVMVMSSSVVESRLEDGGFLVQAGRQGVYALIGVPMMLVASRFPQRAWELVAWPMLAFSSFLQLLVVATPMGVEVGGNTNWLALGPIPPFQPSEMIKVALVIWLGTIVTRKQHQLTDFVHGLLPILLVGGTAIGLVLIGGDLGTVVIMSTMLLGALFLIGVRLRLLAIPVVVGVIVFAMVGVSSESRLTRITSFFNEQCTTIDVDGCWQIQHGMFALANGGVFGVGLGNSAAKWSWLPAADNDFIFAIVGEELGLIGAIVVIGMFVVLAIALTRVLRHAVTPFGRASSAAVLVWVVGQACVNIAVVLKLLPVLGVPLPLVSAGGTALLTTLVAIGIALSISRQSALAASGAGRSTRGSRRTGKTAR